MYNVYLFARTAPKKMRANKKLSIFLKKLKMLTICSHFCVRFAIIACYYKAVPNERRTLWWMFQELAQVIKAKTHYIKVAPAQSVGSFFVCFFSAHIISSLTLSALRLLESGRAFLPHSPCCISAKYFNTYIKSRRTAARNKNKQAKRTVFTRSFLLAKCH